MPSKADQILTPAANRVAAALRKKGWGQKEYLSAGVIAFDQAGTDAQLRYKLIASREAGEVMTEDDRIRHAFNIALHSLQELGRRSDAGIFDSITGNWVYDTLQLMEEATTGQPAPLRGKPGQYEAADNAAAAKKADDAKKAAAAAKKAAADAEFRVDRVVLPAADAVAKHLKKHDQKGRAAG